jgi:hypothetical protein
MKALSQATLVERALTGAVRGFTLHGHADGYALSVQYGLSEGVFTAKRGGPRRFARIETAFALLRDLSVAVVDVRLAPTPSPREATTAAGPSHGPLWTGCTAKRSLNRSGHSRAAVLPSRAIRIPDACKSPRRLKLYDRIKGLPISFLNSG